MSLYKYMEQKSKKINKINQKKFKGTLQTCWYCGKKFIVDENTRIIKARYFNYFYEKECWENTQESMEDENRYISGGNCNIDLESDEYGN